ncbi:MAG TPA: hypothetical protein VGH32_04695 [Pirellulales bacterium]
MPRIQSERPKRLFRGAEFTRLMTMVVMLFVIGIMIVRARDPDTWKWLVSKPGHADQVVGQGSDADRPPQEKVPPLVPPAAPSTTPTDKAVAAARESTATNSTMPQPAAPAEKPAAAALPALKIPPATGPTDEGDFEAGAAIEDFDYVTDSSLALHQEDYPAYKRITRWVVNQPYERLAARAAGKNPAWGAFVTNPQDFREPGKVFSFVVHLRMSLKFDTKLDIDDDDDPHEPVTLYELWGNTDESPSRLSYFLVYDPPAGLPLGKDLREDVRFVGYFFRVQGYEPAKAKLDSKMQLAPTFIGRIAWKARWPGNIVESSELPWLFILVGGAVVLLAAWMGYLLLGRRSRNVAYLAANLPPPPELQIENWLDRVDAGQPPVDDSNGHVAPDDGEFGASYQNGHSDGHAEL